MAKLQPEFEKRNVKIIGLSADGVENHDAWAKDIEETQGTAPKYPIIGDTDLNVAKLYDMLPAGASGDPASRTPPAGPRRITRPSAPCLSSGRIKRSNSRSPIR